MNVSLTTELENFIHGKVSSGLFQNASEVVRAAVRVMMEEEAEKQQQLAWIRRELDDIWENRDKTPTYTPEEVKAYIAEQRKKRQNGKI